MPERAQLTANVDEEYVDLPTDHPLHLPGRLQAINLLNSRFADGDSHFQNITTVAGGTANVWQPSDLISYEDFDAIRDETRRLAKDYIASTVGHGITEDGLPSFTPAIAGALGAYGLRFDGSNKNLPLVQWLHAWAAEEGRHGRVLERWLLASGRITDQATYERMVHQYVAEGLDLQTDGDIFLGLLFVSFQEFATQQSHAKMAKIAGEQHAPLTQKMFAGLAKDEGGHGRTYIEFVRVCFEAAPDEMMQAFLRLHKSGVGMPGDSIREVSDDGTVLQTQLFHQAYTNLDVLTSNHACKILGRLLKAWGIAERTSDEWKVLEFPNLHDRGSDAQKNLVSRQNRLEALVRRQNESRKSGNKEPFDIKADWITDPK